MAKSTRTFLNRLKANVDAWYAGQSDYETFTERQRATWDATRGAGQAVEEMVLRALRDQLPPAMGSRR